MAEICGGVRKECMRERSAPSGAGLMDVGGRGRTVSTMRATAAELGWEEYGRSGE